MTLSDADRAAIEARAEAATPGPWHRHTYGHRDTRSQVRVVGKALREAEAESGVPMTDLSWVHQDPEGPAIALTGNGPRQTENADFIAHARTDIPALLAALSDALAERDAVGELVAAAQSWRHSRSGDFAERSARLVDAVDALAPHRERRPAEEGG